ncbi:hypothetical protein BJX64DRAFT_287338 [Aspergillus heterothallicus]
MDDHRHSPPPRRPAKKCYPLQTFKPSAPVLSTVHAATGASTSSTGPFPGPSTPALRAAPAPQRALCTQGARRNPLQLEYWAPWVSMQVVPHAYSALPNNPFIHLHILRWERGVAQSRLFLQQSVDYAPFHSGWVFRLLKTCEERGCEVYNPFLAHVVSAAGTII